MKSKKIGILLGCCALILTFENGCVSVSTKNTSQPIVDLINAANQRAETNRSEHAAVPAFAEPAGMSLNKDISANVNKVTKNLISMGLYKYSAVKSLVAHAASGQPVKLSNWQMRSMAKGFLSTLHTNSYNGSTNISDASLFDAYVENYKAPDNLAQPTAAVPADLPTVFQAYYIAYSNGKFTLRDGTVLGKPTGTFSITNGNFSGSIPNDTVDGIVTVFTEALSDSLLQTPIFFGATNSVSYNVDYVMVKDVLPLATGPTNGDSYLQVYRRSETVKRDYFLNGNLPTAAAFMQCIPVVDGADDPSVGKTAKGLTKDEVQFIRAVSSLTAKQSQALGSLILQTWGGGSVGQFAYLHVSVGNNQMLVSIVQNLLSSVSYHAMERALTTAFWDYDGKDQLVDDLLKHYQDLIKVVSNANK